MSISEKYRITKELGGQSRRKFGKVYLIESKSSGERYILKSLKKDDQNEQLQARLKNESLFTFTLESLPKVIDFIDTSTELLLILQYKEGITLDEYWKKTKRKDKFKTIKIITEKLVPIFEEIRIKNIVHCDVKPSNILIEEIENELKIHLLDFGLAINTKENNNYRLLFPLGYAAPELILNRTSCINHTSDIFSLGIVFWRLFEDRLPLSHPNPSIYTNLQITYPLPDAGGMSKELNRIVKKMCTKHQFLQAPNLMQYDEVDNLLKNASGQRYQSLEEIFADLQHIKEKKSWLSKILS